jgi:acyl-CoA thioester hydrolase
VRVAPYRRRILIAAKVMLISGQEITITIVTSKFAVATPHRFTTTFTVPPDAIDELGHVSNLKYIAWMQEVAIQHSAARGWPVERYLQGAAVWVVRSHYISYLRPAFEGDVLTLETWVAEVKKSSSLRKYVVLRPQDEAVLAEAETNWVFVDRKTGRPCRIPDDLRMALTRR